MYGNLSNCMKNILTCGNKITENAMHQMKILLHIFKNHILIETLKVIFRIFKMISFRKGPKKNIYCKF